MALTDESGGGIPATMLVGPANFGSGSMPYPYPVYGGMGGGNSGLGNDGGWWIVLLIIVIAALGGNWGGNNGGGFGGGQPIVINDGGGSSVQRGFDQAAVMAALTGISSGICTGFGDVQNALCSGFAQAEIADNARQMANMQQMFSLSSQFADCCCKNQLATESLRATVLSENCADRFEAANNTRDIIASQTAGFQRILDQMCADKIDAKNEKIADLERQLTMANLAASQIAQTAQIVDQTYNRLSTCPVGTVPVYGEQPIFRCNNGCGCGNNMGGFNGNF